MRPSSSLMDLQLQDVVKQIADAVDRRLADRFDEAEARLGNRFDEAEARLGNRFDEAEAHLASRFDEAGARLANRFDEAEARLANAAKAHMEELRDLVKVTAEGYGATLDGINRRLDRIEKKVDDGFADQGKVLREHTMQVNALKHRLSPPRPSRR